MRVVWFLAAIIFVQHGLISCLNSDASDPTGEYKTKTGKTIIINEVHTDGQSLSTITVSTRDFEFNYSESFVNMDPISNVLMADLDGNGYDEMYIITTSAGSGSYGRVLGIASNRDKSMSMINCPDVIENESFFKGYMGHDTYEVKEHQLIRTFPVYHMDDPNNKPTGGKRMLVYGLYSGEAMWQLKIEKSETQNRSKSK